MPTAYDRECPTNQLPTTERRPLWVPSTMKEEAPSPEQEGGLSQNATTPETLAGRRPLNRKEASPKKRHHSRDAVRKEAPASASLTRKEAPSRSPLRKTQHRQHPLPTTEQQELRALPTTDYQRPTTGRKFICKTWHRAHVK